MKADSAPAAASLGPAVFAISAAVLLLELLLTRVFSVVMFHHFSFLAVSIAMSGLGLGGLLVNLRPNRFRADNLSRTIPVLAIGFGLTVIAAMWIAFHTPVRLEDSAANWQRVVAILVASLVPFTIAGLILAHILAFGGDRIPRLYFFDLLGAALACLAMVPLTGALGAPSALLIAAALGTAAGAMAGPAAAIRDAWARLACTLLALAIAGAGAANVTLGFFDLQFAKGGPSQPALVKRWNSFSRVEVRGTGADLERPRPPVSWGFSSRLSAQVRELHLLYDSDAMTQITGFDGDLARLGYLLWDVTSAAHHARTNKNVLVIGAGGGRDVLSALVAGAGSVTGVEINDITVELLQTKFRDFTHGLYVDYPGVTIVRGDGRSFVRGSPGGYDLIQASLVDTWAASSAGAYSLTENSLYTVEAFRDYFAKLSPEGMVSFSRWFAAPPTEVVRTVALAREALRREGVADPAPHIAIVRTDPNRTGRPSLATILVKRAPFTRAEVDSLADWCRQMLFDPVLLPRVEGEPDAVRGTHPEFLPLVGDAAGFEATVRTLPFDATATTDDKPFFFDRVPLLGYLASRIGLPAPVWARSELPLGSRTLLIAFIVTSINALLLLAMPMLLGPRRRAAATGVPELAWMFYFACLGLGFIAIEIVLIQRFQLLLGKPSYALSVVLFSMLSASALGALTVERLAIGVRELPRLFAVLLAVVGAVALASGPLAGAAGAASEPVRIAVAVLLVVPAGFVMGMPFPAGLRVVAATSPSLVSWAWAVNGALSVVGSVLAVIASMTAGFTASMTLGWLSYLAALVLLLTRLAPATAAAAVASALPAPSEPSKEQSRRRRRK